MIYPRLTSDLEVGDQFYSENDNGQTIVKEVVEKTTDDNGYIMIVSKVVK